MAYCIPDDENASNTLALAGEATEAVVRDERVCTLATLLQDGVGVDAGTSPEGIRGSRAGNGAGAGFMESDGGRAGEEKAASPQPPSSSSGSVSR